jgi:hypothetical protein
MPRKSIRSGVEVLLVACTAIVDRRTVQRYLDGRPVTTSSAARIERALRELGLVADAPTPPQAA